jgi:nucleoside diphosphate kinase
MKNTELALAGNFYDIHRRPFYNDLVKYIIWSFGAILEKENAVEEFRTLIGNDPAKRTRPSGIFLP